MLELCYWRYLSDFGYLEGTCVGDRICGLLMCFSYFGIGSFSGICALLFSFGYLGIMRRWASIGYAEYELPVHCGSIVAVMFMVTVYFRTLSLAFLTVSNYRS